MLWAPFPTRGNKLCTILECLIHNVKVAKFAQNALGQIQRRLQWMSQYGRYQIWSAILHILINTHVAALY